MRHAAPSLLLALVLVAFFPAGSPAEQVEHHGVMIESEGTSSQCLSCHDGISATAVSYCTVKCDFRSSSHAIEREYPPGKNRDSYATAAAVTEKGVKLIEGKVTCISCHDLKNPARRHLITKSVKELCLICHFKLGGSRRR
jgi:predicted CXXCH cytochrome family protein